ncbi:hypothetical protein LCGC14_2535810, partial [marine sediment metagenome]
MSDSTRIPLWTGAIACVIVVGALPFYTNVAASTVLQADDSGGDLILLGDSDQKDSPNKDEGETEANGLPSMEHGQRDEDAVLPENNPPTNNAEDQDMAEEPVDAAGYRHRGTRRLREGEVERALADFSRALELAPKDISASWCRAKAFQQLGRWEESLADYRKVVELAVAPTGCDALRSRGYALLQLGDLNAALNDFDKALAADPEDAESRLYRGKTLEGLGRLEEAIQDYTEVIRIAPRHGIGYLNRGNARMQSARHDEAIVDQKRAVRAGQFNKGELIYIDPKTGVEFRFVFVPPSTG